MSDTPNPEQNRWYLEHIDFENYSHTSGSVQIELLEAGFVYFKASIPVDILLIGGSNSVDDSFDPKYSKKGDRTVRDIRKRLGLPIDDLDVSFNTFGDIEMYFDKIPNDTEAWFLILLPLCTHKRPMEKVILDMKEVGGLGVSQGLAVEVAVDENKVLSDEDGVKESRATGIGEGLNKPGSFEGFCNTLKVHEISSKEVALKALYSSEHIRRTVRQFARYKELQEMLKNRSVEDPKKAIKELIDIEKDLDQGLVVANRVIRNTRFNIQLVTPVTDPKDERYHRNYPYVPSSKPINRMSPAEKSQLVLVVLPEGYESKRQTTIAEEFLRASSDWLN